MDRRKLGALAGMLGPVVFVGVFTIEGALRSSYDPASRFVSELSLGPRGWIQIANFVVTSLLYLIFAWGLASVFTEGKASRFGAPLMALIGVGFLIAGVAVMDPVWTPPMDVTTHGLIHSITGAIVFPLMPLSAWVFYRRFREDARWQGLRSVTLVALVIMVVAVVLLRMSTVTPLIVNPLSPYDGLIQRVLLITFHGWVFIFAWRVYNNRELLNT
jgi:hypothetical protein